MKICIYCILLILLSMNYDNVICVSYDETNRGTDNQLPNHINNIDRKTNEAGNTKNSQNVKCSSSSSYEVKKELLKNDYISSGEKTAENNFEINISPETGNLDKTYINDIPKSDENEDFGEIKSPVFKVKRNDENLQVENAFEPNQRHQTEGELRVQETQDAQQMKETGEDTMTKVETGPEPGHVTYVGAVLEYEPYSEWNNEEKGYGIIRENANSIVSYAVEAKTQAADILIAPEYGLQSVYMNKNSTESFLTYTQYVPDPSDRIIPCHFPNDSDHFEAMQILSCGAIDNEIYLVVDLAELYPCSEETISVAPWKIYTSEDCPEKGFFAYNTQVVFDRAGAVIARYRKQHLYLEDPFSPGPLDDTTAIFVTDFNVTFSLLICFDIVYEHPGYSNVKNYGIRDVAYSTAWVDELPFDLADAIQNGWSRGLGINLLVSGYHDPDNYKLGSGIYRGYSKDLPVYTFDKTSGNVLLVAPVTTVAVSMENTNSDNEHVKITNSNVEERFQLENNHSVQNLYINEVNRTHYILHQNLSEYTRVPLSKGEPGEVFNITACSNGELCCDLIYEHSSNLTYLFLVFSGTFPVGNGEYNLGVQQCGVVWCRNENYKTCAVIELGLPESDSFGPFKISSSSFSSDFVYAIGNHRNLSLINNSDLDFTLNGTYSSLSSSKPVENHLTVALYGRCFSKDS